MTADEHRGLLAAVRLCVGKVMLSGYPNDLYDRELRDWHRIDTDRANHAAGGKKKRRMTECVWCNFSRVETRPADMGAPHTSAGYTSFAFGLPSG